VPSVTNPGGFVTTPSVRLADTRVAPNLGCVGGVAGGVKRLILPSWLADASSVGAIVVNVTVVDPTATGFLRMAPAGAPEPRSVAINYSAGRSIANQVTLRPTATSPADVVSRLDVWVSGGCPHVLVDLVGLHAQLPGGVASAGGLHAIEPARVLDTRSSGPCVTTTRRVQVAGTASVPSGARSVVVNATALRATAAGELRVSNEPSPTTPLQTVWYRPTASVTNAVTVPLDIFGGLHVSSTAGCPDLLLDVLAWHSGGLTTSTGGFTTANARRLLDTRASGGCVRDVRTLQLADPSSASAVAVALNVTVLDPTAKGWLTVHSGGTTPPTVASAQFVAGERIAHGLTVEPGAGGTVDIRAFGGGCPHVLVDVLGTYAPPRALEVDAGAEHTCVVSTGDTRQLRCWGFNAVGQLAAGRAVANFTSPSTVQMGPGSAPLRAAAGDGHTCAVLGVEGGATGDVWCSGANHHGQLGYATADRPYSLALGGSPLTGAVDVAAGPRHTCAIVGSDRRVSCVGANDRGQAPATVQLPPPPPPDKPWYCYIGFCLDRSGLASHLMGATQIDVGGDASCAVIDDGRVLCWGQGNPVAQAVPGITDAVDVSVGDGHACAATTDGSLECWGRNDSGQLGQWVESAGSSGPVTVRIPGVSFVTDVSAGAGRTCAVGVATGALSSTDTRVACWGENSTGAVGDGTTTRRLVPAVIPTLGRGVTDVDTGVSHTCAVVWGRVECWGSNSSGQLGNGTFTSSLRPVAVLD
jgi:alpha-tubulin suppressor-like RCC1 family protein